MVPYITRIKQRNALVREPVSLTVYPRLISVDGVDGSGKSTLTAWLGRTLQLIYGQDLVITYEVTNLRGSPGQDRLRRLLEQGKLASEDLCYLAGLSRAYQELVEPALSVGKIVIVDRSEVDLLRFSLEGGNQIELRRRKQAIASGVVTHGVWPKYRILVGASVSDVWLNLQSRGTNSSYDPQSLDEVKRRVTAHEQALGMLLGFPYLGRSELIGVFNRRATLAVDEQFRSLAYEIATLMSF
ncbi:MAG: hypothetical protein Q8Q05_02055 [bacterium]|nr:hypothetical protein [bacterium]